MSDTPEGPDWWQASDGKYYPPQPPTAPPPPPTGPPTAPPVPPPPGYAYPTSPVGPPQSTGMSGCLKVGLIVLAVLFVLGIGSCVAIVFVADDVVDDIEGDLNSEQRDEADDVAGVSCSTNEAGFMVAELRVTNDSSERSTYFIDVAFEAANGDQIDTALASVSSLDPGQSTTVQAVTATQPDGDFTCRAAEVERFSDEG